MYELVQNICSEKYREFILYCLEHSTLFSLTIPSHISRERVACLGELDGYAYQTIETYRWYNYEVLEKPLTVMLFHSHPKIVDFFEKNFGSIFPESFNGPEDLCFFKGDKIIFGSVTHEEDAAIFPSDEIQPKDFMKFGAWEKTGATRRNSVILPDLKRIL